MEEREEGMEEREEGMEKMERVEAVKTVEGVAREEAS